MSDRETAKGFNCKTCGAFHLLGGYVAAHWTAGLVHTCDGCGAKHAVRRGKVKLIEKGRAAARNTEAK